MCSRATIPRRIDNIEHFATLSFVLMHLPKLARLGSAPDPSPALAAFGPLNSNCRMNLRPRRNPGTRAGIARLALVLACLLGTGCSIVGTVYGQLDRLIVMRADEWLALDTAQKAALRGAVSASIERHRGEELPEWVALLRRMAGLVEMQQPAPADLLAEIERARVLAGRSTALLLRPAAEALASMEPAQIEHLERAMQEGNAEYADEFLDPSAERRATARVRRTRDAIERWSGRLDAAQRNHVAALMASVPDGADAWFDYRHAWQDTLIARLRAGDDVATLEQLLHDWWIGDAGMDPDYAAQLERNREIIAGGFTELIATLSLEQRERAARRLRDVAADLEAVANAGA
jgi:hypothetical protein